MIVKITYSSELEDVPQEVAKILIDLEKQINTLSKSIGGKDLKQGTTDVETAVSKLKYSISAFQVLEEKLKDCYSILNGFLDVREKQEQQSRSKAELVKTETEKE